MGGEVCRSALMILLSSSAVNPLSSTSLPPLHLPFSFLAFTRPFPLHRLGGFDSPAYFTERPLSILDSSAPIDRNLLADVYLVVVLKRLLVQGGFGRAGVDPKGSL